MNLNVLSKDNISNFLMKFSICRKLFHIPRLCVLFEDYLSLRDFRVTASVHKEFGCYNFNSGSSCLFHHDMYHVQTLYCGRFSLS